MAERKIIRRGDFLSMKVLVGIKNLMSQTILSQKIKTVGNGTQGEFSENNLIELLEFSSDSLVLSVPRQACATGHILEVSLQLQNAGSPSLELIVKGKVFQLERCAESKERISVELFDPGNIGWKDLLRLFSSRQDEIEAFFSKVRGY